MSPLAADLSDLPRGNTDTRTGLVPDETPRFIGVLAEAWNVIHDDYKPTAGGTRFRHSDAGKCARAISYTAAGIPRSDPMDLTGVWNVTLGSLLHDAWQKALLARYPDAEVEVKCGWDDLDASGHIDAVIRIPWENTPLDCPKVIAYELKTIGGFGHKSAIGKARRGTPAEGPRSEHILQAALNGLAIDADEIVIGYLAKECISMNAGADLTELGRFAAEWTLTRDQFEPLALEEKARIAGILALVDDGMLAARKVPGMPPGAEIVDVATSRWEQHDHDGTLIDTDCLWNESFCNYCSFHTLCATTKPGRISIASVVTP